MVVAYVVGAWFAVAVFLAGFAIGSAGKHLVELPRSERFVTMLVMLIICAVWPVSVPLYLLMSKVDEIQLRN